MTRMSIITIAAAAILALAGTASAQDAKVGKGAKVYTAQGCKMCHSIGGVGNAKGPLDGVGAKLSAAEIKQWIVDPKTMTEKTTAARKPAMKAYPNLPAEDLDALV